MAQAPQRVASVNLCGDQILLALAPPKRIAALGPFARDASISYLSREAESYPRLSGRSEELIGLNADAMLVGPFDNKFMRSVLQRHGVVEIVVDRWTRLDGARRGIQEIAERIGEGAGGQAIVGEIDKSVSRLSAIAARVKSAPSFLILHRRGYVGEGGIVSELLERAGLKDLGATSAPRFLDVERIVSMQPDYLVLAETRAKAEDRGTELLQHPALARMYPESRRLIAPDRLSMCAGPSTPALARFLADQLEQRFPGP